MFQKQPREDHEISEGLAHPDWGRTFPYILVYGAPHI